MVSDELSFAETYEELWLDIFKFCRKKVPSKEIAEDITQETFLKVWSVVVDGKYIKQLRAYVYTAARNLIIEYYRKKKTISLESIQAYGFDPPNNEHEKIERLFHRDEVMRMTKKLSPNLREVVRLKYLKDLSIGEISKTTGLTENTVSVRLHRGVKQLTRTYSI